MADAPTSILEQIANAGPPSGTQGSPRTAGQGRWLDPQSREARFFDQQYEPIRRIALKRNVDPALLLGLAVAESGWDGNTGNYRKSFDPFGATPRGGTSPALKYPSFDAAWQDFDRMWGARIQDVGSDAGAFIRNLSLDNRNAPDTDRRGAYNTEKKEFWQGLVSDSIKGVRKRLPYWQGNLDSPD